MADLTASSSNPTVLFHDTDLVPVEDWRFIAGSGTGNPLRLEKLAMSWLECARWTLSEHRLGVDLVIDKSDPTLTFDTGGSHDYHLLSSGSALSVEEDTTEIASFANAGTWLKTEGNIDLHFGASTGTTGTLNAKRTNSNSDTHTVLQVAESGDVSIRWSSDTANYNYEQAKVHVHQDPHSASEYDCVVEAGVQATTRGVVRINRCDNQDSDRAGVLILQDKDGGDWYLWVDTGGKLRISKTAGYDPRTDDSSSSDSTIVGTQT